MESNKTKKKQQPKRQEKKEQTTSKQKPKVRILRFETEYESEKTEGDVNWLN